MFLDTISLILIVIYIYVLFCMIQKDDYTSMVIATLTICIVLCYRRRGSLRIIDGFQPGEFAHLDGKVQRDNSMPQHFEDVLSGIKKRQPIVSDPVVVANDPGLTYNNVSAYDGLCLKTGNAESWRHSPASVPLIDNDKLFTIQGHSTPEKPVLSDPSSLSGPSLDGTSATPNKMFMFANNQSSPSCCPSTFSTSTGCVCTTDKQMDFVASRGFNNL